MYCFSWLYFFCVFQAAADGLAPDDVADLISSPREGPGMVRDALHNGVASLQLRSQLSQVTTERYSAVPLKCGKFSKKILTKDTP